MTPTTYIIPAGNLVAVKAKLTQGAADETKNLRGILGLYSASNVDNPLSLKVSLVRFFRCVKNANVNRPIVNTDRGDPSVFVLLNPKKPRGVRCHWLPDVLKVNLLSNITKIANSVVATIAVNVVNIVFRPFSMNVKPRKPMSKVLGVVDGYAKIAPVDFFGSVCPGKLVCDVNLSGKNSSLLIVIKQFAQALWGKIGLSHAVVPYKQWIGQRPRCASNTAGLRHFNGVLA